MREWVEQFPLLPSAIIVVGGIVLVSIMLGQLTQRLVKNREVLREHNELAGFIFAVIGVIYAVLLAFIAIGVWERFATAEARTYDESGQILVVYRDSEAFAGSNELRRDLRHYVETIITQEWPALRNAREAVGIASGQVTRIARTIGELDPKSDRQRAIYSNMLSAFSNMLSDRDERLSEDITGLNGVVWWVVFFGAVTTIGFTYLFGFKSARMQAAMIGALAALIGMVIFLMLSMDYPFQGNIQVKPEAFHHLLLDFDNIDKFEGHS